MTSVGAAALHGMDRADTQRKVDSVLQRIGSITKVLCRRSSPGVLPSRSRLDAQLQISHGKVLTAGDVVSGRQSVAQCAG